MANGKVSAEQSFFALDGSLVDNIGSDAMVLQGSLEVDLSHTTNICSKAMFRMADSDSLGGAEPERTVPNLLVQSRSSVFASVAPAGVLIKSEGNYYPEELQELLRWNGSHNFYHQIASYWKIESGAFDTTPTILAFDDWQEHWSRITDTQEDDADEFTGEVWSDRDALLGLTATDLFLASPRSFGMDRAAFNFTQDGSNRHQLNIDGSMPGVDTTSLAKFTVPPATTGRSVNALKTPSKAPLKTPSNVAP